MITTFTGKLVELAFGWVQCKEDPKTPNRSACLTELHNLYGSEPTDEPWCAIFVWTMVNETCKLFNVENKLPQTKSTTIMKQRAVNAGIRVDKKPAPGAIFYYPRSGGGHVGIISSIEGNNLITVEGNVSDAVRLGKRPLNQHPFSFIHVEELTNKTLIFNKAPHYALLAVTGIATALVTWKNFFRRK
jgi:hypothetical protein